MSNEFEQPVEPMSRTEDLLRTGTEEPVIAMSRIEQILRGEKIKPQSRIEDLLLKYNPSDILIEKSITENGTYYARMDNADGYYKVVVDTPVIPPTVLEHLVETVSTNGTHTFTPGTGVDGFSDASITVNVPPNVISRGLTVNGTFSSAVDNKDGYSSVTVNVQEAPVKTTSLSVTENGTYVPGPSSQLSLTIPTIPDEVETDVSAGAVITNFDNLRIDFTNKTTGTTGHVNIYPSAIAVQQIPMLFKHRTLIMGPDGDHYITIVNGYDSIVVLQKGYTITAMKLASYSGYFDEVDVDVPTGPEIDYLYDWDFTESLTDKIEGQMAVLLKDAARDSEGIHFYTRFDGCKLFDSIDLIGKTIEIDISSMDKKGTDGSLITHSRDDRYGTLDAGCTSIYYSQYNGTWGAYGPKLVDPTVQDFQEYDDNIGSDFFEGKTLKIVYVNDGSLLYVNNSFIGFQTNINLFNKKEGPSWYTRHKLFLGGVGFNGTDCFYDAVITGCRIYNNILTEKTITQNGTYYAPDDNVDGYLKINANIPAPHLDTRTIQNNGHFRSDVDGLDGYSNVVVNVADNTPNYEQLNVTQNGVYVPPSSTVIIFGPADGIPENTETQVNTGGLVTRKDRLTVKCVNSTTSESVSASIQTESIVNKAIPQSIRAKTLIICEDADHYVYLTKAGQDLFVTQKGYTFNGQSFELQDNVSAYNQVTVNTPSPKAPTGYNRVFKEITMDLQFDPNGKIKSVWNNSGSFNIGCTLQGASDLNGTITSLHVTGSITDSFEYTNKTGYERCQFIVGFTDQRWDSTILVGYNDYGSAYIKEEITLTNQQEVNDIDILIDLTDPQYEQYASTPKYFFISLNGISGEFDVTLE